MDADCSLIGGIPEQRLTYATKLRRIGVSVFFEYRNRKRGKMRKKAIDECRHGVGGLYDIADQQDREWLDRDDLATAGI